MKKSEKPTKEVKHFLNSAWYCQKQKDLLSDKIEELRSQAEKITTRYQAAPVFGGYSDHRQSVIAEMVDTEKKYQNAVAEYNKRIQEIEFVINALDEYQERIVLQHRYLYFENWQDIALRLHYTERQMHNIHSAALMKLLEIDKKVIENGGKSLFKVEKITVHK